MPTIERPPAKKHRFKLRLGKTRILAVSAVTISSTGTTPHGIALNFPSQAESPLGDLKVALLRLAGGGREGIKLAARVFEAIEELKGA
jgi:hypothetical protein